MFNTFEIIILCFIGIAIVGSLYVLFRFFTSIVSKIVNTLFSFDIYDLWWNGSIKEDIYFILIVLASGIVGMGLCYFIGKYAVAALMAL